MRELEFVSRGDDGALILESPDDGTQFRLAVDGPVRAALDPGSHADDAPERPMDSREASVIDLRPRDIQMRVRAGEEPQSIADDAGVALDKVMRFALPVLEERLRVVDEARRGRARRGPDGHPDEFGALFDARVSALGTEPSSVRWDSMRRPDGGWTVTALFTARTADVADTELVARFSVALQHRSVSALNDVAADLLAGNIPSALRPVAKSASLSPVVPLRPDQEEAAPETPPDLTGEATANPLDDDGEFELEQGQSSGVTPPVAPGRGQRHETRSPLRLPSRRQKARTHPIPVPLDDELLGEYFDNPDLDDGDRTDTPLGTRGKRAGDPAEVHGRQAGSVPDEPLPGSAVPDEAAWDAQALPFDLQHTGEMPPVTGPDGEPAGIESPAPESGKAGTRRGRSGDKPRMPSWDDILLGVRRRSD